MEATEAKRATAVATEAKRVVAVATAVEAREAATAVAVTVATAVAATAVAVVAVAVATAVEAREAATAVAVTVATAVAVATAVEAREAATAVAVAVATVMLVVVVGTSQRTTTPPRICQVGQTYSGDYYDNIVNTYKPEFHDSMLPKTVRLIVRLLCPLDAQQLFGRLGHGNRTCTDLFQITLNSGNSGGQRPHFQHNLNTCLPPC